MTLRLLDLLIQGMCMTTSSTSDSTLISASLLLQALQTSEHPPRLRYQEKLIIKILRSCSICAGWGALQAALAFESPGATGCLASSITAVVDHAGVAAFVKPKESLNGIVLGIRGPLPIEQRGSPHRYCIASLAAECSKTANIWPTLSCVGKNMFHSLFGLLQ
jgi:hypothetical protein